MHRPGIEPGPPAWQASILPLNQRCWSTLLQCSSAAVVAEWLRRLTRNQFPSGSVGSNPTNCVKDFLDDIDESQLSILPVLSLASSHRFLDSLVVRISACHVEGPGSIPGRGEIFSFSTKSFSLSTKTVVAPGEARTHNPGITLCTVYKYRALTDCATGAYWQKGLMQGVGFEPTQSYDYESLNLTP